MHSYYLKKRRRKKAKPPPHQKKKLTRKQAKSRASCLERLRGSSFTSSQFSQVRLACSWYLQGQPSQSGAKVSNDSNAVPKTSWSQRKECAECAIKCSQAPPCAGKADLWYAHSAHHPFHYIDISSTVQEQVIRFRMKLSHKSDQMQL